MTFTPNEHLTPNLVSFNSFGVILTPFWSWIGVTFTPKVAPFWSFGVRLGMLSGLGFQSKTFFHQIWSNAVIVAG